MDSVRPWWFAAFGQSLVDREVASVARDLGRTYARLAPVAGVDATVEALHAASRELEQVVAAIAEQRYADYLETLERLGRRLATAHGDGAGALLAWMRAVWLLLSDWAKRELRADGERAALMLYHYGLSDVVESYLKHAVSEVPSPTGKASEQERLSQLQELVACARDDSPAGRTDVLERALALVGADSGSMVFRSSQRDHPVWTLGVAVGLPVLEELAFPLGVDGSNDLAARSRYPMRIRDVAQYPFFSPSEHDAVTAWELGSALAVAVRDPSGETGGVLFANSFETDYFDNRDRTYLGLAAPFISQLALPVCSPHESTGSVHRLLRQALLDAFSERSLEELCRALEVAVGLRLAVVDASGDIVYPPVLEPEVAHALANELAPLDGAAAADAPSPAASRWPVARVVAGSSPAGVVVGLHVPESVGCDVLEEVAAILATRVEAPHRRPYLSPLIANEVFAGVLTGKHEADTLATRAIPTPELRSPYRLVALVVWEPATVGDLGELRRGLAVSRGRGLWAELPDAVVHLAEATPYAQSGLEAARARATELAAGRRGAVTLVASPPFDNIEHARSVYDACRRVASAARDAGTTVVASGENAADEELLFVLDDPKWREKFVEGISAALYEYDRMHGTELARSVEIFLDENCSANAAARKLFVHPNTLRYRLSRAKALMQLDLADGRTRLAVHLALKLRRLRDASLAPYD